MKKFGFSVLVLSFVSGFSAFAQGGARGGGGGDVLICKGEVSLADTYALKNEKVLLINTGLSEDVLLTSYLNTLIHENAAFGKQIKDKVASLVFNPVKKVRELDDDGIIPPAHCRKKQLAIQNIDAGTVDYNQGLYQQLTAEEKVLFKIHEAFISLQKQPGVLTTAIRAEVAAIPAYPDFQSMLAETLYKEKLVPEFKWTRIFEKLVFFYGNLDETNLLSDKATINDFCAHPHFNRLRIQLQNTGGVAELANYRGFYSGLVNDDFEEFYSDSSFEDFKMILSRAEEIVPFILDLDTLQKRQRWFVKTALDSDPKKDIAELINDCPEFAVDQNQMNADLVDYEKLLNSSVP
jgi:hypothetical protein